MSRHPRIALLAALLAAGVPALGHDAAEVAARAQAAYEARDYATSARLYTEAIDLGEATATVFYNAACSHALAGSIDPALDALERAIDAGYRNADHLQRDTDLARLHDSSRWSVLVQRIEQLAERERMFWSHPAMETGYRERLPVEERIAGLSRFWAEARFGFANFDKVPDLEWDATYLEYLPRVLEAESTADYYRVMIEFGALLGDGHTSVSAPAELRDTFLARPLIRTRLIEGRVLVIDVYDDGLRASGLVPGQEIVAVDGLPVREYAERHVRPYQSASTPQDRDVRTYDYRLLAGPVDQPVRLTLKDDAGKTRERTIDRVSSSTRRQFVPSRPPIAWEMLPGKIAHVRLNTFNDPRTADGFDEAFAELSTARALILDIRENGGGNSNIGYRVLAHLTDRPFATSAWETREYRPAHRAWGRAESRFAGEPDRGQPAEGKPFAGPVLVLTSPRTYSAAEDFAVAFDLMDRGKIVGEPTGGSTGQPLSFRLPGGGRARICAKRDRYPDGREFVGVGVQPDVAVAPTVADIRAGRDTVLEAALKGLQ